MATDLLTASDYYRLAKVYPHEAKFDGEPRRVTEQRRKKRMRLHIARERFDLKNESARSRTHYRPPPARNRIAWEIAKPQGRLAIMAGLPLSN